MKTQSNIQYRRYYFTGEAAAGDTFWTPFIDLFGWRSGWRIGYVCQDFMVNGSIARTLYTVGLWMPGATLAEYKGAESWMLDRIPQREKERK